MNGLILYVKSCLWEKLPEKVGQGKNSLKGMKIAIFVYGTKMHDSQHLEVDGRSKKR